MVKAANAKQKKKENSPIKRAKSHPIKSYSSGKFRLLKPYFPLQPKIQSKNHSSNNEKTARGCQIVFTFPKIPLLSLQLSCSQTRANSEAVKSHGFLIMLNVYEGMQPDC